MIRAHEQWLSRRLTKALRTSDTARSGVVPRIPIRRVADGGFSFLLANPCGLMVADAWWEAALRMVAEEPRAA